MKVAKQGQVILSRKTGTQNRDRLFFPAKQGQVILSRKAGTRVILSRLGPLYSFPLLGP